MDDSEIECASFAELDTDTLYGLLWLRSKVFLVEQGFQYDIDDRDRESTTRHVWIAAGTRPVSTLRVLEEADGELRIGRVCTERSSRGKGHAERLVRFVCHNNTGSIALHAQSYLLKWYEALGFVHDGDDYMEEDTLHTPMRFVR
ncbi:MAG: GNAT family N-acetyltransferase [Mycobacteriales bacterium]